MAQSDEPLVSTQVFRNIDYRWTKFGLSFDDLPILAIPLAISFFVSTVVDVPMAWIILFEICTALFLIAVKWRKPPDYLQGLLILAFGPRRLSHKMRDTQNVEFPYDADLNPRQPVSTTKTKQEQ